MAGPFAAGGTGAVVPGGQAGETAARAVLRPSNGAADTPAAASPVDARMFRRVSSGRRAGDRGSSVDEVIGFASGADGPLRSRLDHPSIITCASKYIQRLLARAIVCSVDRPKGECAQ